MSGLAILEHRNMPTQGFSTSSAQRLMSQRTKSLIPISDTQLQPSVELLKEDVKNRQNVTEKRKCYYNKQCHCQEELRLGQDV